VKEKLLRHVVEAVKDHIELYTHKYEVYIDKPRLVPGYQYDERLAQAICRSACMVVVYWPSYLESDYCLKEIRTMLQIERERRDVLGVGLHGCRLFIPVILRSQYQIIDERNPDRGVRDLSAVNPRERALVYFGTVDRHVIECIVA